MGVRSVRSHRIVTALTLAGVSLVLHAWMLGGAAVRLGRIEPPPPVPVEVALIAPRPPAPVGGPAVAPVSSPPPPSAPLRPRPAVKPVAPTPSAERPQIPPSEFAGSLPDAQTGDAAVVTGVSENPAAAAPTDPTASVDPPRPLATRDDPPQASIPTPTTDALPDGARMPLPVLPESRRQRFRVYWGDFTEERSVARLEYRLEHDGERYEIRTAGEAEGLISLVYAGTLSQTSIGRMGPAGLSPTQYIEQRGRRPERTVGFDPEGRRLTPPGGGAPVPAPAGTQDRLSVFYQIGLMARADPSAFTAGATHQLPVASMRDVRIERFVVVGDEMLMAPGGAIRALHLHRLVPSGTDDPRIDLWLGYDFDLLPVRLRIEDAGRRVLDQVIERGG